MQVMNEELNLNVSVYDVGGDRGSVVHRVAANEKAKALRVSDRSELPEHVSVPTITMPEYL